MLQEQTTVASLIAAELKVSSEQVMRAIQLLDDGATVPFIARYRKEATKGLTDTVLRTLNERLSYLRELQSRRETILTQLKAQSLWTVELEQAILAAQTKTELEDLYAPFRPKRRTKATAALEAGLLPCAESLREYNGSEYEGIAMPYCQPGFETVEQVLEGAASILIEHFAEEAQLLYLLREYLWTHGVIKSTQGKQKTAANAKYSDYFEWAEPIKKIPSHRALALFRGRKEQALSFSLNVSDLEEQTILSMIMTHFSIPLSNQWLVACIERLWSTRLRGKLESELLARLRELADEEAIRVFSQNLKSRLLAPPAGRQVMMGLDPGIRTGIKIAVIDATGKYLDSATVFPFAPHFAREESFATLAKLAFKYEVKFISIGNGTGSRETTHLVSELLKRYSDLTVTSVLVNEAGASVYSASELASLEFPGLDVTIRGAISIARRLQDPLAELVKMDPKSIGAGQYQHDVNQIQLSRRLSEVVEDCVNAVGVDLNTASSALLMHVSGLNQSVAQQIVAYREAHGEFRSRQELKQVPRMGEKTFEQCAGFLRIMNGENPLDCCAVHPEAYPLIERWLVHFNLTIDALMGNETILSQIKPEEWMDDQFGLFTVRDVIEELKKPGRDPRSTFRAPEFQQGVEDISHLKVGMSLEGVVSNVTNFGAFVDIGVHQDGLVHISAMKHGFVKDPHLIVSPGEIIRVTVIEVDQTRRRIGLSMKDPTPKEKPKSQSMVKTKKIEKAATPPPKARPKAQQQKVPFNTALADALLKLKQ